MSTDPFADFNAPAHGSISAQVDQVTNMDLPTNQLEPLFKSLRQEDTDNRKIASLLGDINTAILLDTSLADTVLPEDMSLIANRFKRLAANAHQKMTVKETKKTARAVKKKETSDAISKEASNLESLLGDLSL